MIENTYKIVIIVRGVQGSGKSTYIKNRFDSELFREQTKIFSADDYWIHPITKEYKFVASQLEKAHDKCFKDFLESVQNDDHTYYVVDNTNIRSHEISPYLQVASSYGLKHEIVTIWCDPAIAAARNIHGVAPETIFAKYTQMLRCELSPHWNHKVIYSTTMDTISQMSTKKFQYWSDI